MKAFYAEFLTSGDLCFDVGSNLGNRLEVFRSLGCRVIAIEPQSTCFAQLQSRFASDSHVTLLRTALGATEGELELHLSEAHTIASMSPEWIRHVRESGRFSEYHWDRREMVQVTKLDHLIAQHGEPRFIKIDVEGFEHEVLRGLSRPVSALSFEWTPEFLSSTEGCLAHLATLGAFTCNYSLGESMRFALPEWTDATGLRTALRRHENDHVVFGDVYVRFRT